MKQTLFRRAMATLNAIASVLGLGSRIEVPTSRTDDNPISPSYKGPAIPLRPGAKPRRSYTGRRGLRGLGGWRMTDRTPGSLSRLERIETGISARQQRRRRVDATFPMAYGTRRGYRHYMRLLHVASHDGQLNRAQQRWMERYWDAQEATQGAEVASGS